MHELRNNIIREVLEIEDGGTLEVLWNVVQSLKFAATTALLVDELVNRIDEMDATRRGHSPDRSVLELAPES